MRIRSSFVLAVLVCANDVLAQYDTLPTGYVARPGTDTSGTTYPFSHTALLRYQEVHTSWTGRTSVPPLTAVGFRRASFQPAYPRAIAHTADLELTVGLGSFATFTNDYAANYTAGSTVVFTRRPVSMPDWTQVPPPPWSGSVWLTLDQPYAYAGAHDLVWELFVRTSLPNIVAAGYFADRAWGGVAQPFAAGCTATGRTAPATLSIAFGNRGPSMAMTIVTFGDNLPSLAPVTVALGFSDPNLALPGLCASVRAMPDLLLPVGITSNGGQLGTTTFSFPYAPALRRVAIYGQGFAPDVGQAGLPVVMTDARVGGVGPDPNSYRYIVSTPPAGSVRGPYQDGSVITIWR